MDKLNSKEIIKLLDILIGSVEGIGETYHDEIVLKNLQTLIDVTNWCIDGIAQAREQVHRHEYSLHKIGFTAQCAMQEYHDWLLERLTDDWHD